MATDTSDDPPFKRRNPEVWYTLVEIRELMDKAIALGFAVDDGELDDITLIDLEVLVNRRQ